MINLDFSWAVAIFVLFVLGIVAAWFFSGAGKDRELSLDPEFIWFCSICSYTYVNTKEHEISVCPRCASFNKK